MLLKINVLSKKGNYFLLLQPGCECFFRNMPSVCAFGLGGSCFLMLASVAAPAQAGHMSHFTSIPPALVVLRSVDPLLWSLKQSQEGVSGGLSPQTCEEKKSEARVTQEASSMGGAKLGPCCGLRRGPSSWEEKKTKALLSFTGQALSKLSPKECVIFSCFPWSRH